MTEKITQISDKVIEIEKEETIIVQSTIEQYNKDVLLEQKNKLQEQINDIDTLLSKFTLEVILK